MKGEPAMTQEQALEKRPTGSIAPEQTYGGRVFVPPVDIVEREDELLLLADMPGVRPDEVDIDYGNGLLTIHGKVGPRQDPAQTNYLLEEYAVGDFHRRFEIGESVDAARIAAELRDGVLTVRLPKVQEILPRKITVKGG
jgi:HSP20 family protein